MSFFAELKRRNVIRVGLTYVVASWLLAQVIELAADAFGAPDWVLKLLITLLAIGLLPTLVFAWVYELTPEGIRKESEIAPDESITAHTAKKLNVAVIVLLVAAMGMFAADRFLGPRGAEAPTAEVASVAPAPEAEPLEAAVAEEPALALGVAVLPFANLSTEVENAFFASGVHEDVLTYLSRVGDLRVISRTSVENYADSSLSLPAIGRELGVSHVVEGSVRRSGNRVRVTVQLIDVETDAHIWSENYDRTLDDIFAIQTEIAQAIVGQLEAELTPEQAAVLAATETSSIEAYDAFLEGREILNRARTNYEVELFIRAAELFEDVVTLDPAYVPGWMNLLQASAYAWWFRAADDDVDYRETVRVALARMRELSPGSIETRTAEAIYLYRIELDNAGAVEILGPVVAERPNDLTALEYLATAGRRLQLWSTAIEAARRSVILDPANEANHKLLIEILTNSADYGAALDAAAAAVRRFPDDLTFRLDHAQLRMEHLGDPTGLRQLLPSLPPAARTRAMDWADVEGVFPGLEETLEWLAAVDSGEADPGLRWRMSFHEYLVLFAWGEEERARARAREDLGWIKEFYAGLGGRQEDFKSFFAAQCAAAGDIETALALRKEALARAAQQDDILRANGARVGAAWTLAIAGDPVGAWREAEALIDQPGSFSRWELFYGMVARRFYGDAPGYQALTKELEAELEARQ